MLKQPSIVANVLGCRAGQMNDENGMSFGFSSPDNSIASRFKCPFCMNTQKNFIAFVVRKTNFLEIVPVGILPRVNSDRWSGV